MGTGLSRWLGLAGILMLAAPIIAACGGGDEASEPAEITVAEASATSDSDSAASDSGAVQVDFAPEIGSIDNWYNGGATSLADLRGSPVLLVFWADY